jgi:hypothetical protein
MREGGFAPLSLISLPLSFKGEGDKGGEVSTHQIKPNRTGSAERVKIRYN